jgi:hypothetical protein
MAKIPLYAVEGHEIKYDDRHGALINADEKFRILKRVKGIPSLNIELSWRYVMEL